MSPQADYIVANGTGAAVRSDINGQLAAIVSNNSGATEPATMYAYQWWADTTTGLLKIRNAANSAWVTIGTLASANLGLLPLAGGTMTGVLAVTAGTAALPGIAVSGDLNTGLVSPGADQLAITTGGTSRLAVSTTAVSSTLAVDVPLGAVGTPSITFTGDLNTGLFSPGADTVALVTGGTQRATIDSSGRLLVGPATSVSTAQGFTPGLQVASTGALAALSVSRYVASTSYCGLTMQRSRNATVGSHTVLQSGDGIGLLTFEGSDGTNFIEAASISALVDATPGTNDMPGRLVFSTTADGSASPTEAMRINNQQELLIGTSTRNANGGILQLKSGITFPATAVTASDANTLDDYEEGTWTATIVGTTTAGTATYASQTGSYTKVGRAVSIILYIAWSGHTGTGNMNLHGLPFTSASGNNSAGVTIGYLNNLALTALNVFSPIIDAGQTKVDFYQSPVGGGAIATVPIDAAAAFALSCTYFV